MVYVLEWRASVGAASPPRGLVSHVRVFRSVSALKAFVRSRRFAGVAGPELRLSLRGAKRAGPLVTTRDAIFVWDAAQTPLPAPLTGSRWESDLALLGLVASIGTAVAAELERARRAGLLSDGQVRAILDLLARGLTGEVQVP